MIDADRARVREMLAWALCLVGCLIALILAACANTQDAIAGLPEGWGGATWRLVEGVFLDACAVLEWVAGLLLV